MNSIKKRLLPMLVVLSVLIVLIMSNVMVNILFTKLEKVTIQTDKLEDGRSIKILQITDVHNRKIMNSNQQLLQLVQRVEPDLIVITGDLIDKNTKSLDHVYALVEGIIAINPKVYFVTGNHEWRSGLANELKDGLTKRGVIVLDNKSDVLQLKTASINLCGVADWTSGILDLKTALQGVDNDNYTVMLAHDPWIIYDYKDFVPDLTLCGHTHGGQVRLPIAGAIVAPGQKLFPELDKGIYKIKNDQTLYIDSGVGTSVFPIRFLNQSQMTLITIE